MNRAEPKGRAGSHQSRASCLRVGISHPRATLHCAEKRLCPKRAPGQHRVQPSRRGIPRLQERLNHKRGSRHQVALDQRSRDPQDAKAPARELPIASRVVSALRLVALVPINLDDERGFASEEVDDVIANHDLPPKLHSEQPASSRQAPHQRRCVSGILTKRPSALFEERFAGGALS